MNRRLAVALSALVLVAGCSNSGPAASSPTGTATAPSSSSPSPTPNVATRAVARFAPWRLPAAIAREGLVGVPGRPGTVLITGGMLPGDTSTDRVVQIDLRSGRTQLLRALGVPVHDLAAGLYNGHPAVFGGGNATEQSVVQVFTGGSWRPLDHFPTTRSDLSAVQVAGRTYVIGGYDGTNVPREVYSVGATGGLRQAGMLDTGVRYAATAVVGSKVYVFGGEVNHLELGQVQVFDTKTGRTTVVANLPRPLGHAVAATVGGRILLLGGRIDPNTMTAQMWWFDPSTKKFTRAGSLPAATSDSAVATLGRQVWLVGGENSQVTDRVIVIRVS